MVKMVMPDYFEKFRCTGAVCESNCCKNWRIDLEKSWCEKMNTVSNSDLQEKMQKIKLNAENQTENRYAVMALDEQKNCIFLDSDSLCSIYKNYGEENLSYICKTYPRVAVKCKENYKIDLYNSCPETVKYFFENRKITFITKETDGTAIEKNFRCKPGTDLEFDSDLISERFIKIMQKKEGTFDNKLYFLLQLAEKIDSALEEKNYNLAKAILEKEPDFKSIEMLSVDKVKLQLESVKAVTSIFLNQLSSTGKEFFKYVVISFSMLDKLKADQSESFELFKNGYNEYYKRSIENYGDYLENYSVNLIFKNLSCMKQSGRYFQKIIYIIMNLIILRTLIIGSALYYKKSEAKDIGRIIYNFARVTEHREFFSKRAAKK